MQIQQQPSPNKNRGRQGRVPDIIVCHITEGAFAGAVSWITNPTSRVSYHYVVAQNGQIVQAVDIEDTAWANGTTNGTDSRANRYSHLAAVRERGVNANLFTISIGFEGRSHETAGRLTPAQFEAGVWLIGHIRGEVERIYGIDIPAENIVGHADITPRWKPNCPGREFPFEEIRKGVTPDQVRNHSVGNRNDGYGEPSQWARDAWEWAMRRRITDGTNPRGTPTREQMVQLLYNYSNSFSHDSAEASLGI